MKKSSSITALKSIISLVILYALFLKIDISSLWEKMRSVHPGIVLLGACIFIGVQCVSTYRWSIILEKDVDIPYRNLLSIYFIGMFFNNFLPTMIGGDAVKGYYLYKVTGKGASLASIFMDRYSGFTALIFIVLAGLVAGYPLIKDTGLPIVLGIFVAGYFLLSLVLWVDAMHGWMLNLLKRTRLHRVAEKIDNFYNVLMSYKKFHKMLVKIFLYSMVVQIGGIIGYYVIARGLQIDVPLGYFFIFILSPRPLRCSPFPFPV
ncbi:MAG: lysylphosphatidylglycerol synthase transmembrane domain-containing protein [Candidatus Manganitrophus sp.]|nr:MAG: lysylphosphatidylglycerol synthase transmembrane domain-containing protein [Candidatus Manganitrophus sp.]